MATQTEYLLPATNEVIVTPGSVTRQWMAPQGVVVNEVIAVTTSSVNPVVQTTG